MIVRVINVSYEIIYNLYNFADKTIMDIRNSESKTSLEVDFQDSVDC